MSEVWKALGLIALGMLISEAYNVRCWHTYYKGRRDR